MHLQRPPSLLSLYMLRDRSSQQEMLAKVLSRDRLRYSCTGAAGCTAGIGHSDTSKLERNCWPHLSVQTQHAAVVLFYVLCNCLHAGHESSSVTECFSIPSPGVGENLGLSSCLFLPWHCALACLLQRQQRGPEALGIDFSPGFLPGLRHLEPRLHLLWNWWRQERGGSSWGGLTPPASSLPAATQIY